MCLFSLLVVSGAYFYSHSLSWSNNKENNGVYGKKVWVPGKNFKITISIFIFVGNFFSNFGSSKVGDFLNIAWYIC